MPLFYFQRTKLKKDFSRNNLKELWTFKCFKKKINSISYFIMIDIILAYYNEYLMSDAHSKLIYY